MSLPTPANLVLTGMVPAISLPVAVRPTPATLALTGAAALVTAVQVWVPTAAGLFLIGGTPDVLAPNGPGPWILSALPAGPSPAGAMALAPSGSARGLTPSGAVTNLRPSGSARPAVPVIESVR
jgi:hypothetical protein